MSKLNPIFTGTITKSQLLLDDPSSYELWLGSLDSQRVEVSVRKERKQRSNQQNRWYWSVIVPLISEETGYDEDTMHEILKSMFLKRRVFIKEIEHIVTWSTRKLSTAEMVEYCERVRRFAAMELGISIPDPKQVE